MKKPEMGGYLGLFSSNTSNRAPGNSTDTLAGRNHTDF